VLRRGRGGGALQLRKQLLQHRARRGERRAKQREGREGRGAEHAQQQRAQRHAQRAVGRLLHVAQQRLLVQRRAGARAPGGKVRGGEDVKRLAEGGGGGQQLRVRGVAQRGERGVRAGRRRGGGCHRGAKGEREADVGFTELHFVR
jgi:hypothetical protein